MRFRERAGQRVERGAMRGWGSSESEGAHARMHGERGGAMTDERAGAERHRSGRRSAHARERTKRWYATMADAWPSRV